MVLNWGFTRDGHDTSKCLVWKLTFIISKTHQSRDLDLQRISTPVSEKYHSGKPNTQLSQNCLHPARQFLCFWPITDITFTETPLAGISSIWVPMVPRSCILCRDTTWMLLIIAERVEIPPTSEEILGYTFHHGCLIELGHKPIIVHESA